MGDFGQRLPALAGTDLIKPPVPEERMNEFYKALKEAHEKTGGNPPDWLVDNLFTRYFGESLEQAYKGGEQAFGPGKTLDERLGGASEMMRGGMKFAAPFVLPEALSSAPLSTLTGLGTGIAVGAGTEEAAKKLGAGPGLSQLAGDVTGLGVGGWTSKPENLIELGRGFDRLDFGGERGSISNRPVIRDIGHMMDNPLELKGKGLTLDMGKALDDAMKEISAALPRFGKDVEAEPYRQRALEMMFRDATWAIRHLPEASSWYTRMLRTMEHLRERNELDFHRDWKGTDSTGAETDGNTRRALFKYLLGITSNGVNPEVNFDGAMRGWDIYKRTGRFMERDPDTGKVLTRRFDSYADALDRFNRLIQDKGGERKALEWLHAKHPMAELKRYDPKIEGAATYERRLGSYIFGEKVGAFGANMNGLHTELTADVWWSRTWNRWMGTVMATKATGEPVIDSRTGELMMQEDPRSFRERELMRETTAAVAEDLGLKVSELQALLWYAEQALYRQHGIDATSIGFDDAAQNYFTRRSGVRPGANVGDRPQAPARGPNANPGAPQRGAPKTPARVPKGRTQGTP